MRELVVGSHPKIVILCIFSDGKQSHSCTVIHSMDHILNPVIPPVGYSLGFLDPGVVSII